MSSVLCVTSHPEGPDHLRLLSHTVTVASSSEEALRTIDGSDVVLVDGRDDLAWARAVTTTLRSARDDAVILLLIPATALALLTPDWGLTDFITDAAQAPEIDVRIRLRVRPVGADQILLAGPIRIDEAAYHATLGGESLDLTYTEFELLRYLVQHQGRVLTREVLLSQVWGYDYFGGTRTVDVHIRRLRAKLGQYDNFIATVRNVGYRFTSLRESRDD